MWREGLAREPRPGSENLVAEVGGEVVGFASVGACARRGRAGRAVCDLPRPARWGTGVGRALIERAEESMRASGFAEARLWVLEGNERAERFYRAAGWEQDGRKVDEFQGAEVVELRYRRLCSAAGDARAGSAPAAEDKHADRRSRPS